MSYLYTGTPALKTDFTRTGKRTYVGALNDGINSVTRYYINNFTDGYYHDCLDIATMKLSAQNSKLKTRRFLTPIKVSLITLFLMTLFAKFVVENFILPPLPTAMVDEQVVLQGSHTLKQRVLHALVVFGTFLSGFYFIF